MMTVLRVYVDQLEKLLWLRIQSTANLCDEGVGRVVEDISQHQCSGLLFK